METSRFTRTEASGNRHLVGWTPESGGRGTLTLVSTCLFTIFLCTWVVIHPRVHPRPKFRHWHKVILFLKTVVAPEFIAVEGAQEWTQARRIVKDCHESTAGEFSLIQAFYIGMLAIRYRCKHGSKVVWPNQFVWLLQEGLIEWRDHPKWGLSSREIHDRSKADSLAKLFALTQVAWFVAQSIMRAAHDLPLAPLESMTLSYIPLFAITYFFWWVKPKDIETALKVDLPRMGEAERTEFEAMAINNAFDEDNSLWIIWSLTPRVFEKEDDDRRRSATNEATTRPHNPMNRRTTILSHGYDPLPSGDRRETTLAHWDPDLYRSKLWPVICLFGVSFGALHLISWNAEFPTAAELWLWRASAIMSILTMLVFMHFERVTLRWNGPLTIVKIASPILYLLSRLAMVALAAASFRAADPRIYDTYVVSNYWLHVSG